ncbi:MAG: hypothetical protein QM713_12505 [Arachnia sp.]
MNEFWFGSRNVRTAELPMAFRFSDALLGVVLAWATASLIGPAVVFLMGDGAAAYLRYLPFAPYLCLPSVLVGGAVGVGIAMDLRSRAPWRRHVVMFAVLGAACGVVNLFVLVWHPLAFVWGAVAGAAASVVGYVVPMAWVRRRDRRRAAVSPGRVR